jgi:hypothetical protein
VLVLLQGQVTFLPYHREWIVWLHRTIVLTDLAVIWYFWIHLRSHDDPINRRSRKVRMYLGGAGTLCVVIFSTYLATFPGEWIKTHLPELSSLQALLFEGDVDVVSGRPQSVFSNRLVLTNQSVVVDPEKLKITVSRSFRGRDLRLAVLSFADLRKADFFGAQLQGASLELAQLQGALLKEARLGWLPRRCFDDRWSSENKSSMLNPARDAKANGAGTMDMVLPSGRNYVFNWA